MTASAHRNERKEPGPGPWFKRHICSFIKPTTSQSNDMTFQSFPIKPSQTPLVDAMRGIPPSQTPCSRSLGPTALLPPRPLASVQGSGFFRFHWEDEKCSIAVCRSGVEAKKWMNHSLIILYPDVSCIMIHTSAFHRCTQQPPSDSNQQAPRCRAPLPGGSAVSSTRRGRLTRAFVLLAVGEVAQVNQTRQDLPCLTHGSGKGTSLTLVVPKKIQWMVFGLCREYGKDSQVNEIEVSSCLDQERF